RQRTPAGRAEHRPGLVRGATARTSEAGCQSPPPPSGTESGLKILSDPGKLNPPETMKAHGGGWPLRPMDLVRTRPAERRARRREEEPDGSPRGAGSGVPQVGGGPAPVRPGGP